MDSEENTFFVDKATGLVQAQAHENAHFMQTSATASLAFNSFAFAFCVLVMLTLLDAQMIGFGSFAETAEFTTYVLFLAGLGCFGMGSFFAANMRITLYRLNAHLTEIIGNRLGKGEESEGSEQSFKHVVSLLAVSPDSTGDQYKTETRQSLVRSLLSFGFGLGCIGAAMFLRLLLMLPPSNVGG